LYKEYKLHSGIIDSYGDITALDWLVNYIHIYSSYYAREKDWKNRDITDYSRYETKDDIIKRIKTDLSKLLVIDGVLYECCGFLSIKFILLDLVVITEVQACAFLICTIQNL